MTSYGQWLRTKRRELGLTQRDVEERTGIGDNALSKIENDRRRPTAETRREIHRVLGTSEAELASLGILEQLGGSDRYDWPDSLDADVIAERSGSTPVTRHDALNQIRDAAGDMLWTQAMVDTIVQQVKLLKTLQSQR